MYYNFFIKLYDFKSRIKMAKVDFDKPWWEIIWKQKWIMGWLLLSLGIINLYDSVIIVWITQSLEAQNINQLALIVGVRVLMIIALAVILSYNAILQMKSVNSVFLSANQKLLEIDPIYHTTKSSGVIISKVSKGSAAYEDVLDILVFEIYALITSIIGSIFLLVSYNLKIGIIASVMVVIMTAFSIYWNIFNNGIFKPICIEAEDKISEVSVETLQQTHYIRSVFGTNEQLKKLGANVQDYVGKEATRWETDGIGYYIIRIMFFVSVFVISALILSEVQNKNITIPVGVALITSYYISSANIRNIGSQVKRLTSSYSRITDLFEFMQSFGKQTYPVLDQKIKSK
jgi:ABC-type transport system involved in Fe-S cluster assembly fused permease/ATPase subunit